MPEETEFADAKDEEQPVEKSPEAEDQFTGEDKTASSHQVEQEEQEFYDAEEEEQKVTADPSVPKVDEIQIEVSTNLQKLDQIDGPDETTQLDQINDASDFKIIEKLDKNTYITDEHRNYTPTEEDIFIRVKKTGVYQRLIWGEPVELKGPEVVKWMELQQHVANEKLPDIPPYYLDSNRMGQRYTSKFLQGSSHDKNAAMQIIYKHHAWYSANFPCDGSPYMSFLRSGAIYVAGRCKRGH